MTRSCQEPAGASWLAWILPPTEGETADDDHVTAVVVRRGAPGFRHNVLVSLGSVAKVRNDEVELSITEAEVDSLPTSDVFGEPAGAGASLYRVQRKTSKAATAVFAVAKRLTGKVRQVVTPQPASS